MNKLFSSKSFVIAMGGPNGAGKSTLIRHLRDWYEAQGKSCFTLRSDEIRKEFLAMRDEQTNRTDYPQISTLYLEKLKENIGRFDVLLLDAAHTADDYRARIEKICIDNGADFTGFKFVLSQETCWQRLQARDDNLDFANKESLAAHFTDEVKTYSPAWMMIDGEKSAEAIFNLAKKHLASKSYS